MTLLDSTLLPVILKTGACTLDQLISDFTVLVERVVKSWGMQMLSIITVYKSRMLQACSHAECIIGNMSTIASVPVAGSL